MMSVAVRSSKTKKEGTLGMWVSVKGVGPLAMTAGHLFDCAGEAVEILRDGQWKPFGIVYTWDVSETTDFAFIQQTHLTVPFPSTAT